ncbi:nitric oxide reductase transcriptional regulator NorR [Klebsiella pneumoniae]
MSFSVDELARIAIDLQSDIGHTDRFSRLITTLRQILGCDASALLRYEAHQFVPLAIDGLAQDVLGRRFALEGHPRLEAIARAGDVVRFPADSDLPDPYDGLIPGHESLKVHACVGLPLFAGQTLIGALTLDGMDADRFDSFSDEELRLIAALVAGALNNALLIARLEAQNVLPAQAVNYPLPERQEIIGLSGPMLQLKKEIDIVAASDLNVLISGETGTGKELVAKAVHQGSPRAANPLVYLNCAALPESVAESELFGHVKGAFTGAISNRSGKFEMADNGTLFLDEIGELSLALQAKLLRVLQYGDIQRVGDDRSLRVDVRVLAATNRDLRQEVVEGRFRADLYHRLSVFPLSVPPLRERESDVVLLARATQAGDEVVLEPQHFQFAVAAPMLPTETAAAAPATGNINLREATDSFQREAISRALEANQGNWAATARALELDVANLHRLAKRLGLKGSPPGKSSAG